MKDLLATDVLGTIIQTIGAIVVALISGRMFKKVKPPPGGQRTPPNYPGLIIAGVAAALTFSILGFAYNALTAEPTCDNLLSLQDELVPSINGPSRLDIISSSVHRVTFDFENGKIDQTFSGIAFKFDPALRPRGFNHLEISGTSTKPFKFVVEYKLQKETVAASDFKSFPSANPQTIRVPVKYVDKSVETVDEIALMFYVKGEASQVTIDSICFSK